MTACAGCGDCCHILNIHGEIPPPRAAGDTLRAWDPGELLQRWHWTVDQIVNAADLDFLRAHWHEIPQHIVREIAPERTHRTGAFYWCDQFDPTTNRCLAHDRKPKVCWDYPWYGEQPGAAAVRSGERNTPIFESPRCSYWADVPPQYWPAGTQPLPSPVNCC